MAQDSASQSGKNKSENVRAGEVSVTRSDIPTASTVSAVRDSANSVRHTPGPWISHPGWWQLIVPAAHAGRRIGGSVDIERDAREYAQGICRLPEVERHRPLSEQHANARLLAAAPELLAALKGLGQRDCFDSCTAYGLINHSPACQAARAAISKAEGAL